MKATSTRRGLAPGGVLFACLFAAQAAILVTSPILPQVAAEFDVTTSAAAQLRSVSGVTAGLAALLIAIRGVRIRLILLLDAGLILLASGSLGSAVAPNFPVLLASQVPIGLGLAMVLSGGLAASEAWASGEESAKVLSWALVGQPVAWIVGQPIVGAVASIDWRWAWIAVPLGSALAALTATAVRRTTTGDGGLDSDPLGLWRLPNVKSWAWGELTAFSAWAGTLVFAGAYFIENYGTTVGEVGFILGLAAAAYLPGNFLGRRWLRAGGSPALLLGFAAALAIGVAVFGTALLGVAFSTVILAALAFFAGGRTIAGAALGLHIAQGRRLSAMSVRTATLQFGYLIGTALGALVLPLWGYAGVGYVFALLFAMAGGIHLRKGLQGLLAYRIKRGLLRRG